MKFIFKNESRPDIAVGLTTSALRGAARFISHVLFPVWGTSEKGNSLTVAQRITNAVTTNRAQGADLSGIRVAAVSKSYTCSKIERRSVMDDEDIKNAGGEEPAIAAGALAAGRDVLLGVEALSAAAVFTDAAYAAASAIDAEAPFAAIAMQARAVKDYGDPVLVCSESWLTNFVSMRTVAAHLRLLYGDRAVLDVLSQTEAVMKSIGLVFGVKNILVGDDAAWAVANKTDAAAVVAVRPEAQTAPAMTVKAKPCFGLGPTFLPDPAAADAILEIDTVFLGTEKDNAVDATAWFTPLVLNAAGRGLVKLPADLNPPIRVETTNQVGEA